MADDPRRMLGSSMHGHLTGRGRPATLLIALALLTAAPGAGRAQSPEALALEGTPWVVRRVVVDGTLTAMPVTGPVARIVLRDGRASGDGGCNAFTASYALDGSAITFGPVGATRRQCLVAAPAEGPLLRSLPLVASWSIADGMLTLAGAEAAPLVELEAATDEATGVRGLWRIAGLAARDGTTVDPTLLARAEATLGGGRFRATVGCNWIVGSYLEDGPRLTVSPESWTLIGCPDLDDAEAVLKGALAEVATWAMDGDALVLDDDDGTHRIRLVPRGGTAPAPSAPATP